MKKKIEKTNYDYVKEFLKGNDEALEFLEAFRVEMYDELDKKAKQITTLIEAEEEFDEDDITCDSEIDFGIGKLYF